MKHIEVTTSQSVSIQYSLASLWERMTAFIIDFFIIAAGVWLISIAALFVTNERTKVLLIFFAAPFGIFYSLAFETLKGGSSPGKSLMRLRVIRADGRPAGFTDYLMRWAFRGIEIYLSMGTIAIIAIISTRLGQRAGDFFAGTVVVKQGKTDRVLLSQLLQLEKLSQRKIVYPQSAKMPLETALLIKETLERYRAVGNDAHDEAVRMLAQKLQKQLQVTAVKNPESFLETVLGDYVVLTR